MYRGFKVHVVLSKTASLTERLSTRKGIHSCKNFTTQSSRKWLRRQGQDEYVKKAKATGSPSRSIFKLEEIVRYLKNSQKKIPNDVKSTFLCKGDTVIDLGAAPGGWSLFTSKRIGRGGKLIAVDLLPMNANTIRKLESNSESSQLYYIKGDFTHDGVKQQIKDVLRPPNDKIGENDILHVDSIISDMAANFTGDKLTDALRTMNLCEDAMMFAVGSYCFDDTNNNSGENEQGLLREGGSFLCKFFACGQGNEKDLMNAAKTRFRYSTVLKPAASRRESAEMYLFCSGFLRS